MRVEYIQDCIRYVAKKRRKPKKKAGQRKTNPTTEAFKRANKTRGYQTPTHQMQVRQQIQDSAVEPNKITKHQTPGVLCWA